ncbi:DUF4113 domain-containing protein [Nitrosomonas sp.]|uniref:DUF4113 domain-containing protein n=1 Tax=Nitrosomonas sp. TaxID=42353 RepID=UPI0032ED20EF
MNGGYGSNQCQNGRQHAEARVRRLPPWKMKQGNRSPRYTTNWNELICVTK